MPGMEDYGIATYTYRKGARVTMEYDWIGKMGSFNSIVGEKGWMRWGYGVKHGCVELSTAGKTRQVGIPGKRDADASVLDHMVRCLDERRETAHPASLGLDNLRIALAAYQASRAGRTVSIPRR
jgi:predicted dehydrogenase